MSITADEKRIIDLEHREARMKSLDDHRNESNDLYAKKDYEKAVRWAIIALAGGVFLAIANAVTGGIIKNLVQIIQP